MEDSKPEDIPAKDSEVLSPSDVSSKDEEAGYHHDKDDRSSTDSEIFHDVLSKKDSGGYDEDSEGNDEAEANITDKSDDSNKEVSPKLTDKIESDAKLIPDDVAQEEPVDQNPSPTEEKEGYVEESESEEEESDIVSDHRRHGDSDGYEEESEREDSNDATRASRRRKGGAKVSEASDAEDEAKDDDKSEGNVESEDAEECDEDSSDKHSSGSESDENNNNDSEEEEGEKAGGDNEKEEVQALAVVPRRTGFWDHDDRFEDMPIEESRDPRNEGFSRNRKLWDRTSDRWEHDMYKEDEQGPKEEWEKERQQQNQRRRQERTVGDYVSNARGRGGRYSSQRDRKTYDSMLNKNEEEGSQDSRSTQRETRPQRYTARQDNQRVQNEQPRSERKQGALSKNQDEFPPLSDAPAKKKEPQKTNASEEQKSQAQAAASSEDASNAKKRNQVLPKVAKEEKEPARQQQRQKESQPDKRSQATENAPANHDKSSVKGRGRGMISDRIKKGHKTAAEFAKELKQEKVREKAKTLQEKAKKMQEEPANKFDDAEEAQENEPKTSAKPKRYSSQRLKQSGGAEAGGEEANPEAQFAPEFPAVHEDMQYYQQLGYPQDNIYSAQMSSMLQQPNLPAAAVDQDGNNIMMMQQFFQQQLLQLQMQQLRLRQQQQHLMSQQVNVVDQQQPMGEIIQQPQAHPAGYMMPNQEPRPTYPQGVGIPMSQPLNPEQYQMMMNQMAPPRMYMPPQTGGLFIPNQMQQQQQQQPVRHAAQAEGPAVEDDPRTRQRPAAIPIKPPPEAQTAES